MKPGRLPVPRRNDGGPALDVAAAVEEFYQEFPQHRKDVFVLNPQQHTDGKAAVAAHEAGFAKLAEEFPKAMLPFAKSLAAGAFKHKLPMSVNVTDSMFALKPDTPIFARIVMPAGDEYTAKKLHGMFTGKGPRGSFPVMKDEFNNSEMWQRYVLDHELGHALTQMSMNKQSMKVSSLGNKAECEADCYSMIRHYQRYGAQSDFPDYIRDLRNMNAIQRGDVIHWTSPALDEVISLNKQGKLANLTPAEARDLAVDIAKRKHLSADAENNMTSAFVQTLKLARDPRDKGLPEGDKAMKMLAAVCDIGATTDSPAVLDACQRFYKNFTDYVPQDLPQSMDKEQLQKTAKAVGVMSSRQLDKEPELDGLKRIFRDAVIDFASGKKPGEEQDNKPPAPPKKPDIPKAG